MFDHFGDLGHLDVFGLTSHSEFDVLDKLVQVVSLEVGAELL